jgi:H+/Cl- antiporter ClcA
MTRVRVEAARSTNIAAGSRAPKTLAQRYALCLFCPRNVQRRTKRSGFESMAKSALAGFLAFVLLFAGIFSVSYAVHRSLHRDASGISHVCLVCSLVKGQVSAADVTVLSVILIFCSIFGLRLATISPSLGIDYRLSPSRAPPRRWRRPAVR